MTTQFDEITVDNSFNRDLSQSVRSLDIYPFYVCKNRRSSRRRSSLQSLQHRRCSYVRRLVRKSGKASIHRKANSQRSYRLFLDIGNTLIDSSWLWTIVVVVLAFVSTWLMFAGLWAIISIDNNEIDGDNGTAPCLEGIYSFAGYLLFSVETQSSIGYGYRYINDYCPEAIFVMCVQIVVGVCICGTLICVVYLKMVAPRRLRHSLDCFSKKATICKRDGAFCLIFRVRDFEKRHECHTNMFAYLVQKRSGELWLKTLKLVPPGILIWPVEVVHKIDQDSPLWDFSAKDLIVKKFEIIVVMEGSSLATSQMSRTTTSYLNKEILWGHKFVPCTEFEKTHKKYIVNHKLFNKTQEVSTPLCSAKRLAEVLEDVLSDSALDSAYQSSLTDTNSKFSSPMMSPFSRVKDFSNRMDDVDEDEFGILNSFVASVIVHQNVEINKDGKKSEGSSSSDDEDYKTFMDLRVEDLTEKNMNRLSVRAKDLLSSLQRFVSEENHARDKSFKETAF